MKSKSLLTIVILVLCFLLPGLSNAQTTIANVDATVQYTEPDTLQDGVTLAQLQHTTMYFEVRDVGGVVLDQWTESIAATALTGGGDITYTLPPRGITPQANVLMVWASATNTIGESIKSGPVSTPIPKVDLTVPEGVLNLNVTISIIITTPPVPGS